MMEEGDEDGKGIPLAIQTYFWRQTSQFLKQPNSKTHEAACVLFEHVICDNKFEVLPPSVSGAIESIPRWEFIKCSLPYIIQCVGQFLWNRSQGSQTGKLSVAESKLLYTLHWILMQSPSVCCQDLLGPLFDLSTVELFVHQIIPCLSSLKEFDLTFRLQDGLPLWQPLWGHKKPNISSFEVVAAAMVNTSRSRFVDPRTNEENFDRNDKSLATVFDVAVLKFLCTPNCPEDGVVWSLKYIMNYVQNVMRVKTTRQEEENLNDNNNQSQASGRKTESDTGKVECLIGKLDIPQTLLECKSTEEIASPGIYDKNAPQTELTVSSQNNDTISSKHSDSDQVTLRDEAELESDSTLHASDDKEERNTITHPIDTQLVEHQKVCVTKSMPDTVPSVESDVCPSTDTGIETGTSVGTGSYPNISGSFSTLTDGILDGENLKSTSFDSGVGPGTVLRVSADVHTHVISDSGTDLTVASPRSFSTGVVINIGSTPSNKSTVTNAGSTPSLATRNHGVETANGSASASVSVTIDGASSTTNIDARVDNSSSADVDVHLQTRSDPVTPYHSRISLDIPSSNSSPNLSSGRKNSIEIIPLPTGSIRSEAELCSDHSSNEESTSRTPDIIESMAVDCVDVISAVDSHKVSTSSSSDTETTSIKTVINHIEYPTESSVKSDTEDIKNKRQNTLSVTSDEVSMSTSAPNLSSQTNHPRVSLDTGLSIDPKIRSASVGAIGTDDLPSPISRSPSSPKKSISSVQLADVVCALLAAKAEGMELTKSQQELENNKKPEEKQENHEEQKKIVIEAEPKSELKPNSSRMNSIIESKRGSTASFFDRDAFLLGGNRRHEMPCSIGDYLDNDGILDSKVILFALYRIVGECPSKRICDTVLNILKCLIDMGVVKKTDKTEETKQIQSLKKVGKLLGLGNQNHPGMKPDGSSGPVRTSHNLSMDCLIGLFKVLGCPYGCGEGIRGVNGDRLRSQAKECLGKLLEIDGSAFKEWMQQYVTKEPVQEVVDFLHALVGYCMDHKSEGKRKEDTRASGTFVDAEGVEGTAISCMFKLLVTRLAEEKDQENSGTALFYLGEVRQLLQFTKIAFSATFWRVALSGLLDASNRPNKRRKLTPPEEMDDSKQAENSSNKFADFKSPPSAVRRRFLFQKLGIGASEAQTEVPGSENYDGQGRMTQSSVLGLGDEVFSPGTGRKMFALGPWKKRLDDEMEGMDNETRASSWKRVLFKASGGKKLEDIFPYRYSNKSTGSQEDLLDSPEMMVRPVIRETKPVNLTAVRAGMVRFNFLLRCCPPGTVPDADMVASMLDLKAPVVARASLLLELACLVHRCNKGDWPSWLKSNRPANMRQGGGGMMRGRPALSSQRRQQTLKKETGLLFYKWAVALGSKLEDLEKIDKRKESTVSAEEGCEEMEGMKFSVDYDQDFLDEATIDDSVKCPYALKLVACQLLLEITAYMRETHGVNTVQDVGRLIQQQRAAVMRDTRKSGSDRRLSTVLGVGAAGRIRKVSLVNAQQGTPLVDHPKLSRRDTPIITVEDSSGGEGKGEGEVQSQAESQSSSDKSKPKREPSFYNRAGAGQAPLSPNRRTLKVTSPETRKNSLTVTSPEVRRGSLKASDAERKPSHGGLAGNKRRPSRVQDHGGISASDEDDEDEEKTTRLPWLTAVVLLNSSTLFLCDHQSCPTNCHQRQNQSCDRLINALKTVYSPPFEVGGNEDKKTEEERERKSAAWEKLKAGESKVAKYLNTQVVSLSHSPLAILLKAAVILDADILTETLPVAWGLLLDANQQVSSVAAAVFLFAGVRLRETVEEMLYKELTCSDSADRVKSILRFGVLWQCRYHVWPRMQEGAKFVFKVPPPKVDYTLPSPPVGIANLPTVECSWDPAVLLDIVTRPEDRIDPSRKSKEDAALEQRNKSRAAFLLSFVPVSLEASFNVRVGDEEESEVSETVRQVDAELWPAAVCTAVPHIVKLLDDVSVDVNRTTVCEVARRVIWKCLVDDSALFFRTFLEKITKKEYQEELLGLLRKLVMYFPHMPPNAARFLFNNLLGAVMYYARTNRVGSQDSIAGMMSVLWQIVPSVPGLFFKDLKACSKKEHCDAALMITANVPGAKKVAVTCPSIDNSTEKVPVHDEMTFGTLLQCCTQQFSVDDPGYCLVDKLSDIILDEKHYVRDVYPHRKGFPNPQVKLELFTPEQSLHKRQIQAFAFKMAEIGRILLTIEVLRTLPNQKHVGFLHSELSRQISFPRRALNAEFALCNGGTKGKELFGLDVIHKQWWLKLLCCLFENMSSSFPWGPGDLHLFLNVFNGTLLLHCEDSAMLRLCLATLINTSKHFTSVFAIDGYQHVIPTMLSVYCHHQGNEMVCMAIEFVFQQFYALHQKPFLLQMFASAVPILCYDINLDSEEEAHKVSAKCLFALLAALDKPLPDDLKILELVNGPKPLQPMDSCYKDHEDPPGESVIDIALRLCVTVVAYAPESRRATQMLVILSVLLPHYLHYLKTESDNVGVSDMATEIRSEIAAISSLSLSMQVLIGSCESLTRPFAYFSNYLSLTEGENRKMSIKGSISSISRGSISSIGASSEFGGSDEEDIGGGVNLRPLLGRFRSQDGDDDDIQEALIEFRTPRNALLLLISEFISTCSQRKKDLKSRIPKRVTFPELLDFQNVLAFCDIASSALKLALYDPETLKSVGLQRFLVEALPSIDWSQETYRPGINTILKRMTKIFDRICKRSDLLGNVEWDGLNVFLTAVYRTLSRHQVLAECPHIKSLVSTLMHLVIFETPESSALNRLQFLHTSFPPNFFKDSAVKLAARLMFALRENYSLRDVCGGSTNFGTPERAQKIFLNLLLPLLIRLGSGRYDAPKATQADVSYSLVCLLTALETQESSTDDESPSDLSRSLSFIPRPSLKGAINNPIPDTLYQTVFLGLKILVVCFEKHLACEWVKIINAVRHVTTTREGGVAFWSFIDFVVSHRTPLYLHLLPFVQNQITQMTCISEQEELFKKGIMSKLFFPPQNLPCKSKLMQHFFQSLSTLKQGNSLDEHIRLSDARSFVLKQPPLHRRSKMDESTSEHEDIPEEEEQEVEEEQEKEEEEQAKPEENKDEFQFKRSESVKSRKSVTFDTHPEEVPLLSYPSTPESGWRRKYSLRRLFSLDPEQNVELEKESPDDVVDGDDIFLHQKLAGMKRKQRAQAPVTGGNFRKLRYTPSGRNKLQAMRQQIRTEQDDLDTSTDVISTMPYFFYTEAPIAIQGDLEEEEGGAQGDEEGMEHEEADEEDEFITATEAEDEEEFDSARETDV